MVKIIRSKETGQIKLLQDPCKINGDNLNNADMKSIDISGIMRENI
jgi:hypothetical protein